MNSQNSSQTGTQALPPSPFSWAFVAIPKLPLPSHVETEDIVGS